MERKNAELKELARPSQESLDQDKWKSFYKRKGRAEHQHAQTELRT